MRAKEVVLLIVLIFAGIVFTEVKTGRIDIGWQAGDLEGWGGQAFSYQESQVIPGPLPATLRLENSRGDVVIEGTTADKITVTLEKKVWRRSEPQAREIADGLHLRIDRTSAGLVIGTNREDFKKYALRTNLRLTVPASLAADVGNSHGKVSVRGLGSAVVANPHGEVAIGNMAGDVRIENSHEDVDLTDIRGGCEIRSSHADVTVRAVDGDVAIEAPYALVTLQHAAHKATITGAHSEVLAEDVAGAVDVRNSYDKVTLRRVGPSRVEGHHSDVEAQAVSGGLDVVTSYGDVSADTVTGGVKITGRNVRVSGAGLTGGEISISTSYEAVDLSGFSGKTIVLVSHGDVTLTPLPLTGPIEVRCDYSPLVLHWPAGGPYPLEAQSRSGKIVWNLDQPAHVEAKGGVDEVKAFSGEAGRPGIVLATSYDDIKIEKN